MPSGCPPPAAPESQEHDGGGVQCGHRTEGHQQPGPQRQVRPLAVEPMQHRHLVNRGHQYFLKSKGILSVPPFPQQGGGGSQNAPQFLRAVRERSQHQPGRSQHGGRERNAGVGVETGGDLMQFVGKGLVHARVHHNQRPQVAEALHERHARDIAQGRPDEHVVQGQQPARSPGSSTRPGFRSAAAAPRTGTRPRPATTPG